MPVQCDITPEQHRLLDDLVKTRYNPDYLARPDLTPRINLLQFVLGSSVPAYAAIAWPFDVTFLYDDECMKLLEWDPTLVRLLAVAHKEGRYAAIRNLPILHESTTQPLSESLSDGVAQPPLDAEATSTMSTTERITIFLDRIRPRMKRYVEGEISLPIWNPQEWYDSTTAEFQEALGIPELHNAPDLLLHELGNWSRTNFNFARRMRKIFVEGRNTFLCNVYGSGKTRLLLEGLCRHWGLYITTLPYDTHGSQDVPNIVQDASLRVQEFKHKLPLNVTADSDEFKDACARYDVITERRFRQVLLARLLLMEQFLQLALDVAPTLWRTYCRLWTLLQVAPQQLMETDIFQELAEDVLGDASDIDLGTIRDVQQRVQELVRATGDTRDLFCVIDSAQYAARQRTGSFVAHFEQLKGMDAISVGNRWNQDRARWPILHDMVRVWSEAVECSFTFVVAGTSLEMYVADQSACIPPGDPRPYELCTDTGDFYDEQDLNLYLRRYVPMDDWDMPSRCELIGRMWWFRGRYGFLVQYITLMLKCGYCSPNRCLSIFLRKYTGLTTIMDMPDAEQSEPTLEIHRHDARLAFKKFDFSLFARYWRAFAILRKSIMANPSRGGLIPFYEEEAHPLVEAGWARFDGEVRNIRIDEPLVTITASKWFEEHPTLCDAMDRRL
ncbi:hypothetical protein B0H21DRAFT_188312 [Amylocystis lapponica]|nr:hypothetical protein B0H21DRAFT_188312 [Amylocystis lapponica]